MYNNLSILEASIIKVGLKVCVRLLNCSKLVLTAENLLQCKSPDDI